MAFFLYLCGCLASLVYLATVVVMTQEGAKLLPLATRALDTRDLADDLRRCPTRRARSAKPQLVVVGGHRRAHPSRPNESDHRFFGSAELAPH